MHERSNRQYLKIMDRKSKKVLLKNKKFKVVSSVDMISPDCFKVIDSSSERVFFFCMSQRRTYSYPNTRFTF